MYLVKLQEDGGKHMKKILFNRKEAAAALGVCERTIYNMEKAGIFKPVRVGRKLIAIPAQQITDYIKNLPTEQHN